MNDLDLYHACMNFCRAFGDVVAHKLQLDSARLCFDEREIEELSHRVKIEEQRVRDKYEHLCEVIEKSKE
ncbi:hypothetical protein [uncultured Methanobrevibacter sp.]|uniref:hypothetical protein n=1 Tax=uncultured Methanobrevibacter sp. TaxID=253161 RepID=UPI0025EA440F|nr:hypothetical protein [uncultured Methanobrevibacter sp.]